MTQQSASVVTVILAIVAAGLYLITVKNPFGLGRAPVVLCIIAAALITFFWFLSGSRGSSADTPFDEGAVRKAIAGAIVVEYLLLVAIFAFWREDPNDPASKLLPLTEVLLTHFTTTVGVVIAFYFGASAYVEAKSRTPGGASKDGGKGSSAQPTAAGDAPPAARP
ncbi:MAG: hypothetical protein HYY46_22660 [Deltaproteobacteria bacterium]|nr:hypothetical protein [Deltaproteobacteria bacterium]